MVEAVVSLADVGVCPYAYPAAGFRVFDDGLFVEPVAVDGGAFMQLCAPDGGIVECGDAGEFQG